MKEESFLKKKWYYLVMAGVILIVLLLFVFLFYMGKNRQAYGSLTKNRELVASRSYTCENDKEFEALFYVNSPYTSISNGLVSSTTDIQNTSDIQNPATTTNKSSEKSLLLKLDDGRNVNLFETVSVEGERYSTPDEALTFISQDKKAFIYEFDIERFYKNCYIKGEENPYIDTLDTTNINDSTSTEQFIQTE